MTTQTYFFKTNLNCGNCVRALSPFLNDSLDIESWAVDTQDPDKVLTVATDLSPAEVVALVVAAGFHAEELPSRA
ncbi:MAG: hypothetical protein HC913_14685 [Microscillaceae bacterium]|nr:hypothetical protein [Microscillaceae bacterium]